MKKTSIILASIICIALAMACAAVAFRPKESITIDTQEAATTLTATPTPTATPTTTPTAATTTPVEGKKPLLDPTEDDATPVSESWPEAAIKLWGVGDVAEKQFSHMSSRLYEDKDGTFFTLYQFRVYTYTGAAWEQTKLYPMFGNRIVIDKGRRQIVLGEGTIEVWEQDYWQESCFWNVERLFTVSVDEPDSVRIFGDWVFEDAESIAYIASKEDDVIWAISESEVSYMQYDDILFSEDYVFVVPQKESKLVRVAYSTEEGTSASLNEETLPVIEENVVLKIGDTSIDPVVFVGHFEETNGTVCLDLNGIRITID